MKILYTYMKHLSLLKLQLKECEQKIGMNEKHNPLSVFNTFETITTALNFQVGGHINLFLRSLPGLN